jgi:D-alanine-D-alanine ligase
LPPHLECGAAELRLDADLEPAVRERIRETAVHAFRALGCRGLARVDFFLEEDGRIHVNELNTMPGTTRISMYPKLWGRAGLPPDALISRLIELAHRRD